jgi:DNA helicase HerA-like ATPase
MHISDAPPADTASATAPNDPLQPLGHVLSIGGSQAIVQIFMQSELNATNAAVTVGSFIGIPTERAVVIGVLSEMTSQEITDETIGRATGRVDLLGEIPSEGAGVGRFRRGVMIYPRIGSPVVAVGAVGLQLIFDATGADTINVGHLQQDSAIGAHVNVEQMVRKHFAIFGSTGSGKSSAVAVILREVIAARPDLRVMLIDPHNEYGRCFGERAHVVGPANLRLPFWLFNFEEFVEVVFGGRTDVADEIALLSELIPLAKGEYARSRHAAERTNYRQLEPEGTGYMVDTPVPYRMEDLVALIESRIGKLENGGIATRYQRLLTRINTARRNPRYAFIFNDARDGGDAMADVLCRLLRLADDGRSMTVYQLAGFPAELFAPIVSVLFRTAFEFGVWSEGAVPQLIVCEEAHHYAHVDRGLGFRPARDALARIAKEGRKHGVFLGLVTQRPAELDPTLISQCSTVFAMRMANRSDQDIIRAAVSEAGSRLLDFMPSLVTREALIFGEGVPLLTRLHFKELPAEFVPQRSEVKRTRVGPGAKVDKAFVTSVVERWRGSTASGRTTTAAPVPANPMTWSVIGGDQAARSRTGR